MKTLLLVFLALTEAFAAYAAERVIIYNYDGNANYIRNRKTRPIDIDMTVLDGDLLRVEPDSYIDMSMSGIAGGRLTDEGECLVTATIASGMRYYLRSGTFLANVRQLPSGASLQVETTVAEATTTRGLFVTQILPDPEKGATHRFTVKKGLITVYVKDASLTVTVLEGQTLDVPAAGFSTNVRTATDDEKKLSDKTMSVYIDDSEQNPPPPSE